MISCHQKHGNGAGERRRCRKLKKPLPRIPRKGPYHCASKTISRVLYLTVIYLDAPLPVRSSHPGSGRADLYAPMPVLLRIEFTASQCSHVTGELLPRLSTLTSWARAPYPLLCRMRQSKVISLRLLSLQKPCFCRAPIGGDGAVYLCCTFPQIALGGRYPLSLPCGARTFLMMQPLGRTPRLSVPVALLFYLILGRMSNKLQFFSMADIMELPFDKRGRHHEREGFCIF